MAPRKAAAKSRVENPETDDQPSYQELQAQLAAERRNTATFRSRAEAAEGQVHEFETKLMSSEERQLLGEQRNLESELASQGREVDNIVEKIATLSDEGGKGKEIAQLTRDMSKIEARIFSNENKKEYLERKIEEAKGAREGSDGQRRRAAPGGQDVLANGVPLTNFPADVQQWFKDHPKVFDDARYLGTVITKATEAEHVEGLKPGTEEYYNFIEQAVEPADGGDEVDDETGWDESQSPFSEAGQEEREEDPNMGKVDRPQARAAGPGSMQGVSARPSRRTPTSPNGGRREPLLNQQEKEAADEIFGHLPARRTKDQPSRYEHYANSKEFMEEHRKRGFSMH